MSKQAVTVGDKVYIVNTETGTKTEVKNPSLADQVFEAAFTTGEKAVGALVDLILPPHGKK